MFCTFCVFWKHFVINSIVQIKNGPKEKLCHFVKNKNRETIGGGGEDWRSGKRTKGSLVRDLAGSPFIVALKE